MPLGADGNIALYGILSELSSSIQILLLFNQE